jgi:hypothetical protein
VFFEAEDAVIVEADAFEDTIAIEQAVVEDGDLCISFIDNQAIKVNLFHDQGIDVAANGSDETRILRWEAIGWGRGGLFIAGDLTVGQRDFAVSEAGEALVVGDDDEGFSSFGDEGEEQLHDFAAGGGVEVAGGFIGEEQAGVINEGAGDGDALLFSPAQFMRQVVEAGAEANFFQQAGGAVTGAATADEGGQCHIFQGGQFWEEEVALKDVSHAGIAKACESRLS